MIPIIKPAFGLKELWYLFKPINNPVKKFEEEIAKLSGCKYSISFPYARTGLYFLFRSLGVKNQQVACTNYTCIVTPHAISLSNNRIKFCDTDQGFNTSSKKLENGKSKIIIYTHMYGKPISLNQQKNILQIEDSCLGIGTEVDNKKIGSLGDVGVFSFNISKHITSLEGGCLTTNNKEIIRKIRKFTVPKQREAPVSYKLRKLAVFFGSYFIYNKIIYSLIYKILLKKNKNLMDSWNFDQPQRGQDWNYKLTNLQARIGLAQLTKLQCIIANKIETAKLYEKYIKNKLVIKPDITNCSFSHYTVRVPSNIRNKVVEEMEDKGVKLGTAFNYACANTNYYKNKKFKNSDKLAETIINLPIYYNIKKKDIRVISKLLNDIVEKLDRKNES